MYDPFSAHIQDSEKKESSNDQNKQHKMIFGSSSGLGISSHTGLGATGLGLIPNLDLRKHNKT